MAPRGTASFTALPLKRELASGRVIPHDGWAAPDPWCISTRPSPAAAPRARAGAHEVSKNERPELSRPLRLLLGPGPSTVHPRVLRAMSTPLLGHLDPKFLGIMNEVQAQLRAVLPHAEPLHHRGLRHRVGRHGGRAREPRRAGRHGDRRARRACSATAWPTSSAAAAAQLVKLEVPWGETCDARPDRGRAEEGGKVKAVAIVHAETSTGAQQPIEGLGKLCHAHGALLVVDTVTSLGGVPVEVDGWEIDAVLLRHAEVPLLPAGARAAHALARARSTSCRARKTKVQSWYLDASMVADYWAEGKRVYHHTAPISMVYALREALRIVLEEGLDARFARHRRHSAALVAGLAALGCAPQAQEGHRLPTLNCVKVPAGVEEARGPQGAPRRARHRDRRRPGPARGQGLAHRAHGRGRAQESVLVGARRPRAGAREARQGAEARYVDGGRARGVRARLTSRWATHRPRSAPSGGGILHQKLGRPFRRGVDS